jgi:hypothetical protein
MREGEKQVTTKLGQLPPLMTFCFLEMFSSFFLFESVISLEKIVRSFAI